MATTVHITSGKLRHAPNIPEYTAVVYTTSEGDVASRKFLRNKAEAIAWARSWVASDLRIIVDGVVLGTKQVAKIPSPPTQDSAEYADAYWAMVQALKAAENALIEMGADARSVKTVMTALAQAEGRNA
jgi:hypothetical protein